MPKTLSPWWLLVFLVSGLVWLGALLGAGYVNSGNAPTAAVVLSAAKVVAAWSAGLAALGAFGARRGFVGAHLGLLVGYAWMLRSFARPSDGWADLAGVATFIVCGAIGLGVGLLVDLVMALRRRG